MNGKRQPWDGWALDDPPPRDLPAQPPGWVDPDPLYVAPEPVDPGRPHMVLVPPDPDRDPRAHGCAIFGLGVCLGIVLAFAAVLFSPLMDAAPRPPLEAPVPSQGGTGAPPSSSKPKPTEVSGGAPAASPTGEVGTALIGGWATWYDVGPGFYAAAGPELRAALGPSWRGQLVEVEGPGRLSVVVEIVDFCACGDRHGQPTLLDLSIDAFEQLAPLEAGIVSVSIEIQATTGTLPPTDPTPHPDDERMRLEVRGDELYR